jgi:putative surface protein
MEYINLIMPHRFFINRNLNKESEKLTNKINEYETELDSIKIEIEAFRNKKEKEYQEIVGHLNKELQKKINQHEDLKKNLSKYVELCLKEQILWQNKRILELEKTKQRDYSAFLTKLIQQIAKDIELLEQRKIILNLKVDISSILRLASLSGCEIKFPTDNINDILETIQKEISNLNQDDWVRKTTLLRLKRVVQEHMESQKMIQYIDWVIQQKKLSSKKLASKRKQSNNELNLLEKQIFEAKQERKKNREQMGKLAHSVRCFWVKPLLDLDVKISNVRKKKAEIYTEKDKLNIDIDETKTKKRQISKEIEDIKKSRSSNSSWDDLWKEKNKLSKRLDDLCESKKQKSQELSQLYEDQKKYNIKKDEWLEKRRVLLSLLKNNKVNSKLLKQSVKADEKEIAKKEIEKINQKKVDFEHRESERVKREKETLRTNFKNDLENLELKIQSAIGNRSVAESEVKESRNKVALEKSKDTRLIKVFDSPKVKEAKKALSKSEELLSKRTKNLEELQMKEIELKSKYNKELSTIRPKSYNMSAKDKNNFAGYQLLLKNFK